MHDSPVRFNLSRLLEPDRIAAFGYAWVVCLSVAIAFRFAPAPRVLSRIEKRVRLAIRRRSSGRATLSLRRGDTDHCLDRAIWAVPAASRRVPGATCLVKALAGRLAIARCGRSAEIRIGVLPDGDTLIAHAWLELDGRVVIGGEASPKRYSVLPGLPIGLVTPSRPHVSPTTSLNSPSSETT